jgi:hypothetical protein
MATRYYNLENEAKALLKLCKDRNVIPYLSNKDINDFVILQKNRNVTLSLSDLFIYNTLPTLWYDSSNSLSYKPETRTTWTNLIAPYSNATLNANTTYSTLYNGGASFPSAFSSNLPWGTVGITNNFTIDLWTTITSWTGAATSALFINESYLTWGFRSGLRTNGQMAFWSSESGGNFNINSSANSVALNVPVNITLSYSPISRIAKIYINGTRVVQSTNVNLVAPTNSTSVLGVNQILNLTSTSCLFHNFKLYNRELSELEVGTNYSLIRSRFGL